MVRYSVAVAALAIVWIAWRHRAHGDRARVWRWLLLFAALFLAQRALHVAAALPALAAASAALLALAGVASIAVLWPLAHLALQGFGAKRDRFVRLPVFALAMLVLLIPGGAAAGVTTLAVFAAFGYGWRRPLATRDRFGAALLLLALTLLGTFTRAADPAPGHLPKALHDLARSVRILATLWALLGVFKAFAAFVSDPSLGIRTIGRRLALSHVLVVLVPLLITGTLWLVTTWLGVNTDRAAVAGRAFEATAGHLQSTLDRAVTEGRTSPADLRGLGDAQRPDWPGLRIWRADGGALVRVMGDSIAGEPLVREWLAAPDSVYDRGVVVVDTVLFAGARARSAGGAIGVVALAPLAGVLAAAPTRVAGSPVRPGFALRQRIGRFWIDGSRLPEDADADDLESAIRDTLRAHGESLSGPDSMRRARLLPTTRRLGVPDSAVRVDNPNRPQGSVVIGTDAGTYEAGPEAVNANGGMWTGQAYTRCVTLVPGRAINEEYILAASASLPRTLTGMWRDVDTNAMNAIPAIITIGLLLLLLPVAAFNFAMVGGMGRSIAQATSALRRAAAAIGGGDLRHRVVVRGDDDLWDAAKQFNRMAEGLERARALEQERSRLEGELEVARHIQARLLPARAPDVPGIEVAGHSESAREIGGDYFDHIPVGDGRVLLVVADVSGKGVPAALLMSAFRASLMSQEAASLEPAVLASRLNAFLHRSVDPGKFVTAFVGFLDGRSGRFVYANAGHNPPLLLREDGRPEWLSVGGLILGILPEAPFESGAVDLAPGDVVVLYTDGVTEGANASGEQWGEERLVEALRRRRADSASAIAHGLVREVRAFEGDTGPADDITVLVARRRHV